MVLLILSRQNGGVVDRLRYADVRPYVVPDTLDELVGPLSGVVELPTHLAWSGLRCCDLGDERQLGLLYETVIRESMDIADIDRYLNATVLHQGVAAVVAASAGALGVGAAVSIVDPGCVGDGCAARTRRPGGVGGDGAVWLALAGGYAVQAHGFLQRPSEDVDLFTVADAQAYFNEAITAAVEAYRAAGLAVEILRHNPAFARLHLTDGQGGQVRVEMGIDWRAHPPVTLEIGAVLHPDDAVANKLAALYGRAADRDYVCT